MAKIRIDDIKIGERRRTEIGDVTELAASIDAIGLLQDVVVTPARELIAGRRRIEACKSLGWETIGAKTVNLAEIVRGERDENLLRKDFTPSECVAIGEAVEAIKKAEAKERKHHGKGRPKKGSEKFSEPFTAKKSSKDRATKEAAAQTAAAAGMSRPTYQKAKAVVAAAKKSPKKYGAIKDRMDATGKVDGAFKALQGMQRKETRRKQPKVAEGTSVITGDFRDLSESIPDASVSLIFTDPPYDKKSIPLYEDLARVAERVLIPGGSLITYLGQYAIPEVCSVMSPHIKFLWPLCVLHTGQSARMNFFGIVVKWKPLLWFVNGGNRTDTQTFVDDLVVSEQEKGTHDWQQSMVEASYYIEKITLPGEVVYDPFCGGGTTAVACKKLGRQWVTHELDSEVAGIARKRIDDAQCE